MISFRSHAEVGAEQWDAVVHASPDGWAYCTSPWRTLILDVAQWELQDFSFAACEGERVVGVMPLQYQAASRRMASTGWGQGGPVVLGSVPEKDRAQLTRQMVQHAEGLAAQQGAATLEITVSPLVPASLGAKWGVNPFVTLGYEDYSTQSLIADLRQSEDDLWSGLSSNARQMVRKAEKAGYRAVKGDWAELVDAYYRVHSETYHRTGVTPHPKKYFEGIARHMAPRGYAALWAGLAPDGVPVAFHNDTRFCGASLYATGCAETAHLDSGINYLLFWSAMLGARREGCTWYEVGEVFPDARDGKSRGLTVFKSKFGGELHRSFKARRAILADSASAPIIEPAPVSPAPLPPPVAPPPAPDDTIRKAYREGSLYSTSKICRTMEGRAEEYVDRLLEERFALVSKFYTGGLLVDLCCATGSHLVKMAANVDRAVGIDFTARYVAEAARLAGTDGRRVSFIQADARQLPLASSSVDFLYCFSSLYAIPRAADVVGEVGRLLKGGGHAVLDFGNRRSLNVFCLSYYTDWPPVQPLTLTEIHEALSRAGLEVVRHRRFQLLPLWADRPAWLWPLLHPVWKDILKRRVFGRMLDEWISSLPVLRAFAFRHLIVCRKR
jgi:ubiquinone/menaquinone biosynthesis C-methylase UbiE